MVSPARPLDQVLAKHPVLGQPFGIDVEDGQAAAPPDNGRAATVHMARRTWPMSPAVGITHHAVPARGERRVIKLRRICRWRPTRIGIRSFLRYVCVEAIKHRAQVSPLLGTRAYPTIRPSSARTSRVVWVRTSWRSVAVMDASRTCPACIASARGGPGRGRLTPARTVAGTSSPQGHRAEPARPRYRAVWERGQAGPRGPGLGRRR